MQNRGHQPNPPAREGEGRDIIGGASAARANALCQIALGLSQERTGLERPYRDMRVSVGIVEGGAYHSALSFATGTPDIAFAVARGEIDVAALNPASFLTLAYRGTGPFPQPLPLRAIATMPSWDRMVFAVSERTGLTSLGMIRERQYPLRLSIRLSPAHATRFLIDQVLDACGFSLGDIESWGGSFQYVSTPGEAPRMAGIRDGTVDAVFDEGIKGWGPSALQHGMRFLPLDGPALQRIEALGWATGPIPRDRFPGVDRDIPAASFSGWPLFTHTSLSDDTAYAICRALDAARGRIAWDTDGPVDLADLCRDTDAAPRQVPLHPGAERYYAEQGAL